MSIKDCRKEYRVDWIQFGNLYSRWYYKEADAKNLAYYMMKIARVKKMDPNKFKIVVSYNGTADKKSYDDHIMRLEEAERANHIRQVLHDARRPWVK